MTRVCPKCSGRKDYKSALCRKCRTAGLMWKKVCPACGGRKSGGQAKTCRECMKPVWDRSPIGTKTTKESGYVLVKVGEHSWRHEHVLKAERAMGRRLRAGECVHHVDGNKANNENSNLVACTISYHRWLESRMADLYKKEHFTN